MNDLDDIYADTDSLFGSPPPSLPRGRSPLPALSASSIPTRSAHENVGTIALPGSHNCSELPVNLPACEPRPHVSGRRSSVAPVTLARQGPKSKKMQSRTRTPSSTPTLAPEILLPNSEAPRPTHFLRNQQSLLGVAGLVGGVNPARLTTKGRPGASARNPIVVEEVTPSGPARAWRAPPRLLSPPPLELPTPSTDEIVAALIGQKNIFPVLRGLLPLLGLQDAPRTPTVPVRTGWEQKRPAPSAGRGATPEAPPPKKKKLNHVPAGAVDWDVPYPFPQAEGPSNYRTVWEKERGKRLIGELMVLVKDAVRKAATRAYVQQKKQQESGLELEGSQKHYRRVYEREAAAAAAMAAGGNGSTSPNGIPNTTHTAPTPPGSQNHYRRFFERDAAAAAAAAGGNSSHGVSNNCTTESTPSQPTPFDQLIASFLAQTTGTINPSLTSMPTPDPQTTDAFQLELDQLLAEIKVGQEEDDFGTWSMSDSCMTSTDSPTTTSSTRLTTPFDGNKENDAPGDLTVVDPSQLFPGQSSNTFDFDFAIDPALLEESISAPFAASVQSLCSAESALVPPLPTMSSIQTENLPLPPDPTGMDVDPAPPSSALSIQAPAVQAVSVTDSTLPTVAHTLPIQPPTVPSPTLANPIPPPVVPQTQTFPTFSIPQPPLLPLTVRIAQTGSVAASSPIIAGSSMVGSPVDVRDIAPAPKRIGTSRAAVKAVDREDVLRRAKERRVQLLAEVARSKVELWETSIEQAVLVDLLKDSALE